MTIAVVTVAYGDTYRRFLPEWADSIRALHTSPDEIVIATDDVEDTRQHIGDLPATLVPIQGTHRHHPQVYVNQAIAASSSEWITKMDVDDLFYPHALDDVQHGDGDVTTFGIMVGTMALASRPVTSEQILNTPENLVFSGSPFRRWLWIAAPFRDMIYEDWAFWRAAAKQHARFIPTGRVDYHYRLHGSNISQSADDAYWRSIVRSLT